MTDAEFDIKLAESKSGRPQIRENVGLRVQDRLLNLEEADWVVRSCVPAVLRNSVPGASAKALRPDLDQLARRVASLPTLSSVDIAADACVILRAVAACSNGVIAGSTAVGAAVGGLAVAQPVPARTLFEVAALSLFNTTISSADFPSGAWSIVDPLTAVGLARQTKANLSKHRTAWDPGLWDLAAKQFGEFPPSRDTRDSNPVTQLFNTMLMKDSIELVAALVG